MATIDTNLLNKLNNTTSGTSSTKDQNSAEAIQNRFLTMLTAQMQAQDPLNPMDTGQMTTQMAQISTVSGIGTLNQTIQQLFDSQASGQSLAAANLIGNKVLAAGNLLPLQNGVASGVINLAESADLAQIEVLDGQGVVVDTLSLSKPDSGETAFQWDGTDVAGNRLPDGNYSFRVRAEKGGAAVSSLAMAYYPVTGVTMNQGTPQVILSNGTRMDLTEVKQVS